MTSDRKKAAFFLVLTLVVGILIGMMAPALFWRMRHRGDPRDMRGGPRGGRMERHDTVGREWLTPRIIHILQPDSDQVAKIRPLTKKASEEIKTLEKESNGRMIMIMDSLYLQLRPILTPEQNQKLADFSSKARKRMRR